MTDLCGNICRTATFRIQPRNPHKVTNNKQLNNVLSFFPSVYFRGFRGHKNKDLFATESTE